MRIPEPLLTSPLHIWFQRTESRDLLPSFPPLLAKQAKQEPVPLPEMRPPTQLTSFTSPYIEQLKTIPRFSAPPRVSVTSESNSLLIDNISINLPIVSTKGDVEKVNQFLNLSTQLLSQPCSHRPELISAIGKGLIAAIKADQLQIIDLILPVLEPLLRSQVGCFDSIRAYSGIHLAADLARKHGHTQMASKLDTLLEAFDREEYQRNLERFGFCNLIQKN